MSNSCKNENKKDGNMDTLKKIDPEEFLVVCNATLYHIDEQKEKIFHEEVKNFQKMFNVNKTLAENYVTKMYPKNNIVFKAHEDVAYIIDQYIEKISAFLDDEDKIDKEMYIPSSDYNLIVEFEC